jgi:hypothetical protein
MTKVSALPFMLGIAGGMLLFVAWLPLAVSESRRPYRWRETPSPAQSSPARRRDASTSRFVELVPRVEAPVVEPIVEPRHRHPAPARLAIVVAAFTVWSLWSLRSRSDHR